MPLVFFSDFKEHKKFKVNLWSDGQLIWCRRQVLSHWLTLDDIVNLDTATSCRVLRKELKRMYQTLTSCGANKYPYSSLKGIRWVMHRGIRVSNFKLELEGHTSEDTWPTFHYLCSQESTRDVASFMAKNCHKTGIVNTVDHGPMWTSLHYAVKATNLEVAKMLIEVGKADVNARNGGGYTPLLVICVSGVTEDPAKLAIVRLLIKHGVNLETRQGISQFTPLHWCCHLGNVAVAKLLISGGADITSLTLHKKSPLDLAQSAIRNRITTTGLILRELKKLGLPTAV